MDLSSSQTKQGRGLEGVELIWRNCPRPSLPAYPAYEGLWADDYQEYDRHQACPSSRWATRSIYTFVQMLIAAVKLQLSIWVLNWTGLVRKNFPQTPNAQGIVNREPRASSSSKGSGGSLDAPPRSCFPFDSIRLEWSKDIRCVSDSDAPFSNTICPERPEDLLDFSPEYRELGPKRKQVYLWQCVGSGLQSNSSAALTSEKCQCGQGRIPIRYDACNNCGQLRCAYCPISKIKI